MIAFLISMAPFLPVILQIVGFLINMFGTSKENLAAYQKMIEANKDAGLITVDTYKKLVEFHQQLKDDYDKLPKV
jgi:hypothetical protein